ncbi:unnamed protein product [Mytilus edulis]|uniref:Tyr recombinase domain-containing protein n=1 Tax=Mytilus edulis TaxID=6550 RepID=A0A8S3QCY6_MYTED|nr:unnamed protein product [Mytilus edulis]
MTFYLYPPPIEIGQFNLQKFLDFAAEIGLPIKSEKTVLPTTKLIFLGLELDSEKMEIRLPLDKLEKVRNLLGFFSIRFQTFGTRDGSNTNRCFTPYEGSLRMIATEILEGSLTKNSFQNYNRSINYYKDFLALYFPASSVLPISLEYLVLFIAYCMHRQLSFNTVSSYVSMLNYVQKMAGFPDLSKSFVIKKCLEGFRKKKARADTRLPITPAILKVHAVWEYCKMRGIQNGPLFCFMDGKPIPRQYFTRQLQLSLQWAGCDTAVYKGHSFRIGAASSAAMMGISSDNIQLMGRWHSDAYKKYIRIPVLNI